MIADAAGQVDNNDECWEASLHTQAAQDDATIDYDCLRAAIASTRELYAEIEQPGTRGRSDAIETLTQRRDEKSATIDETV